MATKASRQAQIRRLALRRARRRAPTPAHRFPAGAALSYRAALVRMFDEFDKIIREEYLPALPGIVAEAEALRQDSPQRNIKRKAKKARERAAKALERKRIRAEAAKAFDKVNNFNAADTTRVTGASSPAITRSSKQLFVQENVSLVKGLSTEKLEKIEQIVTRGTSAGLRHTEIAKEIRNELKVTKNRAKLIAQDQTSKLNGKLTKERHGKLGIRRFKWVTSGDERVRRVHQDANGVIYTWEDGHPTEQFPGWPIRCRCTASPVLSNLDSEEA